MVTTAQALTDFEGEIVSNTESFDTLALHAGARPPRTGLGYGDRRGRRVAGAANSGRNLGGGQRGRAP